MKPQFRRTQQEIRYIHERLRTVGRSYAAELEPRPSAVLRSIIEKAEQTSYGLYAVDRDGQPYDDFKHVVPDAITWNSQLLQKVPNDEIAEAGREIAKALSSIAAALDADQANADVEAAFEQSRRAIEKANELREQLEADEEQ